MENEPAAPIRSLPSDDTLNTDNPASPGVFSQMRASQQSFRRSVDNKTLAGQNKQRGVVGPPASMVVANRGKKDADAITAKSSERYRK
jgi:hypothetical protein